MTKVSVISLISNRDPGQEIGCPSHVCGVSTKWVELLPHTHAVSASRPKTKSDPLQRISRVNEEGESRFGEGELRWKSERREEKARIGLRS